MSYEPKDRLTTGKDPEMKQQFDYLVVLAANKKFIIAGFNNAKQAWEFVGTQPDGAERYDVLPAKEVEL